MTGRFSTAFCLILLSSLALAQRQERLLMDFNWRFHLGSASDATKDFGYGRGQAYAKAGESVGAAASSFNDAGWRTIDLPHDWAIELPFVPEAPGALISHGSKPLGLDYPDTSVGWYRKHFAIPQRDLGKRISIAFDGVFRNPRVWLNGHLLGTHESGYSPFAFDVTDLLNYGGSNTLAVRVDATQYEGWFYEGAGIYRHVWLEKKPPVHLERYGVRVVSRVEGSVAGVDVTASVANESNSPRRFRVMAVLGKPGGGGAGTKVCEPVTLAPWTRANVKIPTILVASPTLWSLESPRLYTAAVAIVTDLKNSLPVDEDDVRFGIRTTRWDPNKGFFLNGKRVEIKGTCNHQDHAAVGAAVPDSVQYFRIKQLKLYGCNAIRTSHNAPTPELLNACDELGMLVMDEHRLMGTSPEILEDLETMIKRDRNHPSVILWSVGNEEPVASTIQGTRITNAMKRVIHENDNSRPITYAGNNGNTFLGTNSVVDVRGWNYYAGGNTDKYHADHPNQPEFGSEEASTLSTRGIYETDPKRGYVNAYDTTQPGWGSLAETWWKYFKARPYLAGAFVWTGFDYRGEPTPYGWPCISSHFGILDTCGFPKDNAFYYQAWWGETPMVHLLPHWNWPGQEGKPINVWVYSNCDKVELSLNGKSLGVKQVPVLGHLEWTVPYSPGVLSATAWKGAKSISTSAVTAGPVDHLVVTPDRANGFADGEDAVVYNVAAYDAKGAICPTADNEIEFSLEGGGRMLGVGNGDPSSHEADTFITEPLVQDIGGWRMYPVENSAKPQPFSSAGITDKGRNVRIMGEAQQIRDPGTSAVFVSDFEVTQDEISNGMTQLQIGQVDDLGWVFLNDQLIGKTTQWDLSYGFAVASALKPGKNTLTVWVKNEGGRGGLGRGVTLAGPGKSVSFKRRLFNGYAQVIVRAGKDGGRMTLVASSKGVKSGSAGVSMAATTPRPFVP